MIDTDINPFCGKSDEYIRGVEKGKFSISFANQ